MFIHIFFQVIPARGSSQVVVQFNPEMMTSDPAGVDCNGYALGYMSLDNKVEQSHCLN